MTFRDFIVASNIFRRLSSLETFRTNAMAKFDDLDAAISSVGDLLTSMEAEITALQAASAADDSADVEARATKLAGIVAAAKAALAPVAASTSPAVPST